MTEMPPFARAALGAVLLLSTLAVQAVCVPSGAPGFVCPGVVPGKEYSTAPDLNMFGALTPLQTLHWIGGEPGGAVAVDGILFAPPVFPVPVNRLQVDALANRADHLFTGPATVELDLFHLLYNVGNERDIRWETPILPTSGLWGTPPSVVPGAVIGTDALEVWGGDTAAGLDANRFSLEGDPGGVAVWTAAGMPLVTTAMLGTSIGLSQSLWERLDLDALMVGNGDRKILFSIAPVGPFDGGEIWVMDLITGASAFLRHGGHLWDTAFPVMATYGLRSEDVTVLEAVDVSVVPEPASGLAMFGGLALLAALARRRC